MDVLKYQSLLKKEALFQSIVYIGLFFNDSYYLWTIIYCFLLGYPTNDSINVGLKGKSRSAINFSAVSSNRKINISWTIKPENDLDCKTERNTGTGIIKTQQAEVIFENKCNGIRTRPRIKM